MTDMLSDIIARKRIEVMAQQEAFSITQLTELMEQAHPCRSLKHSLKSSSTGIIAEFKRKSPSKGWIHPNAQVVQVVDAYTSAGASALSVLTDASFFGGGITDLKMAVAATSLPILRKEFIIHPYQLYQSRALGADAVLLIAAVLSREEFRELSDLTHQLGMEVLLEIHEEKELDYISSDTDLVGVNNRHLGTFRTDVATSFELIKKIPTHHLTISESGISSSQTIKELREAGFRGFLIGETFMKTEHPGETLHQFISEL